MRNKDYYKQANEKIIPTEQLKRETKNKILEKQNKPKRIALKLANIAIVFIFILSVLWMVDENNYKKQDLEIIPITNQNKTAKLKTVDTIDNLKQLIKQAENINSTWTYGQVIDNVAQAESEGLKDETANKEYSTTNQQVENVNEADIVKTDGEHIYYIANNYVYIIGADKLEILSKIEYSTEEFQPNQLFIEKNKLIVIGRKSQYDLERTTYMDMIMPLSEKTMAIMYDITDKSNILKIREIEIEGNLLTTRMIGDVIYLVANKYLYIPNNIAIEDMPESDLVPCYKDSVISEAKNSIALTDIAYFPERIDTNSYLILASFSISNQEEVKLETILSGGNNVYCSEDNIYIAKTKYEYNLLSEAKNVIGIGNDYKVHTEIHKFALNNGNITYINNGSVPGYSINQFAMDEHEGYFRIATTKQTGENATSNGLYVLNDNLNIIGKVENLAKGEKIYSVRFMGEKAYVVTFKQTDPLFVIDLSTPMAPVVLGELKIPGYSQYLHPYDENHLIGFGYNTEVVDYGYGEVVRNTGMKMALFDVTDVANPKELFKVDIGTAGTYSELLYNHKALLFSREKNIIAFPITIAQGTSNRTDITFQGAIVYGLDLENGFTEKAKIPNKETENNTMNYDYTYVIERILYIGDNLYTVSKSLVKKIDINTMQVTARSRNKKVIFQKRIEVIFI